MAISWAQIFHQETKVGPKKWLSENVTLTYHNSRLQTKANSPRLISPLIGSIGRWHESSRRMWRHLLHEIIQNPRLKLQWLIKVLLNNRTVAYIFVTNSIRMTWITFQSPNAIQKMSCSETERRYCHFHLSSSHLAVRLQVKDLKSIILEKSLFMKGGMKITQLVPIICVCNSNELTDIQSPQKKKKFLWHPSQKIIDLRYPVKRLYRMPPLLKMKAACLSQMSTFFYNTKRRNIR